MGPIVKCYNPVVDYGLIKVNTSTNFEIEVENQSPIAAEVLIKNSLNHKLDFGNKMTASSAELVANYSSNASLIFDKPFLTKKKNVLTMDNYSLNLQPHEKKKIRINLKTERPELVEEHFEIMVRDG